MTTIEEYEAIIKILFTLHLSAENPCVYRHSEG